MFHDCKFLADRLHLRLIGLLFSIRRMLNIDRKLLGEISKHASEDYPHECCGVLLGSRDQNTRLVQQLVRCRNVHPETTTRYAIAPDELISIQRDARDLQLEIVGFYHSHPDHPATCSTTDLEEAYWSGCSYLILSVERNVVSGTRSYVLDISGEHRALIEEPVTHPEHRP